ncbi:TSC22 domain family protein 4 isoform X2 [Esox lucius]|uniref:TSC22 domain family member 4 n=1 Tax=Esox lucius TaxID=8010 RepID=A0A6Q2XVZ0_ESOLU|nr:TSC22 domain family protein 4 isoform X2 [Esox lucius]
MSGGKKRSGFKITSVTSGEAPPPASSSSQSSHSPQSSSQAAASSKPGSSHQQGSSSQPTTPRSLRKYNSHDSTGQGSRFRVVRLGQGHGEPYRRGRWICTDFLEREEGVGFRRVMDSMRHAHSLESLEGIGLERVGGGAGGGLLGHMPALRAGNLVHSQGTTHLLAQPIGSEGEGFGGFKPLFLHSGPPSPTNLDRSNLRVVDSMPPPPSPRPRNIPPPLRLDVDASGRSLLRVSHSQPSSPPLQGKDGTFLPSLTPIQTPSAWSMFGTGGDFHLLGEDSGSNSSMIAIDNKIEQAMDLVKTHLMLAVREEVELLREQIKELSDRNVQLERENYILRTLGHRD